MYLCSTISMLMAVNYNWLDINEINYYSIIKNAQYIKL